MRLAWIYLYEQGNNISYVCRHFGIARKAFYKWYKRFMDSKRDPQSLKDRSRKPKNSSRKTSEKTTYIIKDMRNKTGFGADRIKFYLHKYYR